MKIYVDLDHVDITEYTQIESGEYNTQKINFIFTPEYKDLVKVAIFGCKLDTDEPKFYKIYLSDDSCYLPSEVTTASDVISIGVYAFNVENGELKLRYSPTPVKTIVYEGSFREEAENSSSPTPTEIEQIMSRIISLEEITSDLNTRVETLENKACDLDSIKEDVETLKSDVESISGRVDTIESDIDDLEGDIANTYSKTEVDTLVGAKVDTTTYNSGQAAQDEKIAKAELILSQLPKVTGEGTNISLSPTIEYDLEVGYKGDTKQDTLTGKNLWCFTQDRWYSNANATYEIINIEKLQVTSNGGTYNNVKFKVDLPNGTYTFSLGKVTNSNSSYTRKQATISTYTGTTRVVLTNVIEGTPTTQTITNETGKQYVLEFWASYETALNNTSIYEELQIETGSTATTYEPYCGGIPSPNPNYPQDIQVVTGTQEIEVGNKNLIYLGTKRNGYRNVAAGEFNATANDDDNVLGYYFKTSQLPDTVTISSTNGNRCNLSYYNSIPVNGLLAQDYSNQNVNSRTVTINKNYPYVHIQFSYNQEASQPQVEEGSTKTDYIEPTSVSYTLHLGNEELAKIPNTNYVDVFKFTNNKWYKSSQIEKYIIPNNKSFSSTSQTGVYYISNFTDNHILFNNANIPICDKLVGTTPVGDAQSMAGKPNDTIAVISGSYDRFYFKCTEYETSSDILQGLKGSTIYYLIDTVIDTEITNTTLLQDLNYIKEHIKSFPDTTNISTSGNLPIIITSSALKQLS